MANYLVLNQNYVNVGLGTLTFTVPTTGNYNVACQVTELPPSSLVIQVKNNGSTIFTAPSVSATQIGLEFKVSFQATAADSITVVFSSSAANDNLLNSVKANVSIGQGF